MFVDWTGVKSDASESTGDVYVVTKTTCNGGVGKIPVSEHRELDPGQEAASSYSMPRVVEQPPLQINVACDDDAYRVWTGADMAKQGHLIAMVRGGPPAAVYFFPRKVDQSVAEALRMNSCDYAASIAIGLTHETQYEAIGFADSEAAQFGIISECNGSCTPTLYQFELEYPDSNFPAIQGPADGWEALSYDVFENDEGQQTWGNWQSGGDNAVLSDQADTRGVDTCNGNCACQGNWAVQLNQDRGIPSSIFHSTSFSCDRFSLLRIMFQFKFRSFDHLDTLFLEVSLDGGETYFIVGDWAHSVPEVPHYNDSLVGAVCYDGRVTLCPADFRVTSFGDDVKLRFRNSANSDNDRVYIDSVLFEGHAAGSKIA